MYDYPSTSCIDFLDATLSELLFTLMSSFFCEGWGAFSPVAGLVVARFGEKASFNANLIGGVLVLLPTLLLPTHALKQRQVEKVRIARKLEGEGGSLDESYADPQKKDCQEDLKTLGRYPCTSLQS